MCIESWFRDKNFERDNVKNDHGAIDPTKVLIKDSGPSFILRVRYVTTWIFFVGEVNMRLKTVRKKLAPD